MRNRWAHDPEMAARSLLPLSSSLITLMTVHDQSYILHSVGGYIFHVFKHHKLGISDLNQISTHLIVATHRDYMRRFLSFLFLDINTQCKLFVDIVCSDFPSRINRFYVHYNLVSILYGLRFFVSCITTELAYIHSITQLFCSASWYEREIWDLFGVHFSGHPDLRRILTDYGFQGHPLRKDFPLSGFIELCYSERANSIVYQPVSLVQEYRYFDTLSPWDWVPIA